MNSILTRMLLLALALAAVLVALSCAGGDQSGGNRPVNVTNGNTNSDSGAARASIDSSCFMPVANRAAAVNTAIHNIVTNDARYRAIKDQLSPTAFQINVHPEPPGGQFYLHVYLEGKLRGKNAFKKIPDLLEPFMAGGCVEKVWLTQLGAPPPSPALVAPPGLMWGACEDPLVPCPTGECVPNLGSCPNGMVNGNTSNTNSNTGSNSNANSNSNSNANSNVNSNAANKGT